MFFKQVASVSNPFDCLAPAQIPFGGFPKPTQDTLEGVPLTHASCLVSILGTWLTAQLILLIYFFKFYSWFHIDPHPEFLLVLHSLFFSKVSDSFKRLSSLSHCDHINWVKVGMKKISQSSQMPCLGTFQYCSFPQNNNKLKPHI